MIETTNAAGATLGTAGVQAIVNKYRDANVVDLSNHLLSSVLDFKDGPTPSDDMTIVMVEIGRRS